jgi:DNA processing protein
VSGTVTEQAGVLALVRHAAAEWYLVAQLLEITGSATRVISGEWTGLEPMELKASVDEIGVSDADLAELAAMIEALAAEGVKLITILDADYPANLRLIYNRPPFLFVRGELSSEDDRAIAVVGTRRASAEGIEVATRLAGELAEQGVTVLSGLALGIDTAAHTAALDAGGRTVGVVGTGIRRTYPRENVELADRIVESGGAIVSQFWPDAPPTKWSFPLRNITMSGMGVGTIVVEASGVSGARNQARRALEHGKRLFLVEQLVTHEAWARQYAERPGATVVESARDVMQELDSALRPAQQLTLY